VFCCSQSPDSSTTLRPHRFWGEGSQFGFFAATRQILRPQAQSARYHQDVYQVPPDCVMMAAPRLITVASALQGILQNCCRVLILRITTPDGDSLSPQSSHVLGQLTLVQYCCYGAHTTDQEVLDRGPHRSSLG